MGHEEEALRLAALRTDSDERDEDYDAATAIAADVVDPEAPGQVDKQETAVEALEAGGDEEDETPAARQQTAASGFVLLSGDADTRSNGLTLLSAGDDDNESVVSWTSGA